MKPARFYTKKIKAFHWKPSLFICKIWSSRCSTDKFLQQHHSFIISFYIRSFLNTLFFKRRDKWQIIKERLNDWWYEATIRNWMKCSYSSISLDQCLYLRQDPRPVYVSASTAALTGVSAVGHWSTVGRGAPCRRRLLLVGGGDSPTAAILSVRASNILVKAASFSGWIIP